MQAQPACYTVILPFNKVKINKNKQIQIQTHTLSHTYAFWVLAVSKLYDFEKFAPLFWKNILLLNFLLSLLFRFLVLLCRVSRIFFEKLFYKLESELVKKVK